MASVRVAQNGEDRRGNPEGLIAFYEEISLGILNLEGTRPLGATPRWSNILRDIAANDSNTVVASEDAVYLRTFKGETPAPVRRVA